MELIELNHKLLGLVPDSDFKLDNINSFKLLENIKKYTHNIPFNNDGEFWDDFLFMCENDPEKLAKLYLAENESNGELLPHQAFILAILQVLETPRALLNTLPAAHRNLYYRDLLGLSSRQAQPDQVALSIALNPTVTEKLLVKETLFEAGQDALGNPLHYALDASLLANRGYISDLRWLRQGESDQWLIAAPLDVQNQVELPATGIRLFSETVGDRPVVNGCLIQAALLAMAEGERAITLTFAQPVTDSQFTSVEISSGDRWLALTPVVTSPKVTFTLSDQEPAISAPDNLDGLIFEQPVLRLQVAQGLQLPTVVTVSVEQRPVEELDSLPEVKTATATNILFDLYYLTPFGYSLSAEPAQEDPSLYLGFSDIEPGQTLSLYWKLKSPIQPKVDWYYLNQANQWAALNAWVDDGTQNLYQDGGWSLLLPADAANQASQMPTDRYWLKGVVNVLAQEGSWRNYPLLQGVIYNAMTATLINATTISDSHFLPALSAESIQRSVEPISVVSSVVQPWASWGGRRAESHGEFFEREALRLSHRNRALTWGNMATLLKARYTSIFDVKYPTHDELTQVSALEQQQLTVIPANRYNDSDDALRPVLNPARLAEMADWLEQRDSLWASITVTNPNYIDVYIDYQVIFTSGVNPDFGYRQLRQSLSQAYMPWSSDEQRAVIMNNSIGYFQLLATIQQHPLVERVTYLTLQREDVMVSPSETASVNAENNEVLVLVWQDDDAAQRRGKNHE
ncbi:baseplate J/gp47 family protein [Yersinia pekkanenii]|uniref:Baseplate protein J-like domain-containing protein n=1 Tax=Yersinia pekkanenii TaxID=1288385 RepID=A0A0T9PMS3_9GAMM|nr:hypothetical protein [Yersinia pekkanenii]CNH72988.1 Uncharacterised protein [Yersinia pekkanenii]CRY68057.1 Uncharacterised protein [Yersinia pekkanenii]